MEMYGRFSVRRDINKNWEQSNQVIGKNELICVISVENNKLVNKYKKGDGERRYSELNTLDTIPNKFRIIGWNGRVVEIDLDGVGIMFGISTETK